MHNIHVVVNSFAGKYTGDKIAELETRLRTQRLSSKIYAPDSKDRLTECVEKLNADHNDDIIAIAGGDGTLNAAIQKLNNKNILAVIPFGTVNLIAMELGINSIQEAVQRITRGSNRYFSVGCADSGSHTNYFISMFGAGFDADVVYNVDIDFKKKHGTLAYIKSAISSFRSFDFENENICVNDAEPYSSLIICNSRYYGGRFRLVANGSIFSETFHGVGFRKSKRLSFLATCAMLAAGMSGSRVHLLNNIDHFALCTQNPVQMDGDPAAPGNYRISKIRNFSRIML